MTEHGKSAGLSSDGIQLDPRNVRKHDRRNRDSIRQSIKELGAGRSIVVDRDGVVIAGNGVWQEARDLGLPVREIESDGSELVVIRRTDLQPDDPRRKALAIADNRANDLSEFDDAALAELLEGLDVEWRDAAGFDANELDALLASVAPDVGAGEPKEQDQPESIFPEELGERRDYIVLQFHNEIDWLAAQEHFGLKRARALNSRGEPTGNMGVARVVDGASYLSRITGSAPTPPAAVEDTPDA